MKKISYILVIFLSFFILNINANAYYDNCSQEGSNCVTICGYEFDSDYIHFNINYQYETKELFFTGSYFAGYLSTVKSVNQRLEMSDRLVIKDEIKQGILENGVCPKYVYIDNNITDEFCFDNGSYCKGRGNTGTSFNDDKNNGKLVYDINDEISAFFQNYTFSESKILTEDYDLNVEVADKFKEEVLNGKDINAYITNLESYESGINTIKSKFEIYTDQIIKKYDAMLETEEITDEKYQAIVNNITKQKNNLTNIEDSITSGTNFDADFTVGDYCESYLGNPETKGSPAYYLQFVFNLMKYAAILLLFALTIMEYVKAVASSNQDAMKKATQNTIKRIIIAVIIFFLPVLIKFLMTLLGIYSSGTCGIS